MGKPNAKNCPIRFALDLFGDKWTLLIIRDVIFKNKRYYGEFVESDEEISTNILADRLRKLEEDRFLTKAVDPRNKRRFIYRPTTKALDLLPMLTEMILWSATYDPQTAVSREGHSKIRGDKRSFIKRYNARFRNDGTD